MRKEIYSIWVMLRLQLDIQHGHALCDAGKSLEGEKLLTKVVKEDIALQTTYKHKSAL